MLKFRKCFFISFALLTLVLQGCAGMEPSRPNYYGSGDGRHTTQSSSLNNSALTLGTVSAAAAAMVTKGENRLPAVVGAFALGNYLGFKFDQQEEDARQARFAQAMAIGYTNCGYKANKTGKDANGDYSQTARSSKTVPGYKADCN